MALVVKDRVQVSTSTTGTGTLTLGAALGGFQDFSVIGDGNTTYYTITNNGNWEVGIGTYTASGTTLSRDTVLESSNSGNKINLSGSSVVFCTYPAEKSVDIETPQTLTNKTISADNNTLSGIAASSFVLSNSSGNIDGSAAQKVIPSGAVVGTTDTQTLSNKSFSSSIKVDGSTSGSITLLAPAVAGTNTLTLPSETATIATNVNGDLYPLKSGTSVASTSGTSIDFTNIPSWVKRITVILNAVSTNGNANMKFQLGDSGGIETTGYGSIGGWIGSSSTSFASTTGFDAYGDSTSTLDRSGTIVFSTIGSNIWVCTAQYTGPSQPFIYCISGVKTLSDTLTQVRITTTNGTDTFDAGSINILYE
jgi:hypothetical protein